MKLPELVALAATVFGQLPPPLVVLELLEELLLDEEELLELLEELLLDEELLEDEELLLAASPTVILELPTL